MRFIQFTLLLLVAAGCSRQEPAALPAPTTVPSTSFATRLNPPKAIRIHPLAAVPRYKAMHLATCESGIYFVQEMPGDRDAVQHVGKLDQLEPTALTYTAVATAMGFPQEKGNFRGLAASGDFLYFYLDGVSNQQFHCALGRYSISTQKIEIIATEEQLRAVSGAGEELSICHAELACSGDALWLFLHSLDGASFVQLDAAAPDPAATLRRPFEQIQADCAIPQFNHEDYSVNPAGHGGLLILDRWMHMLWEITSDGHAIARDSLVDLPSGVSSPVMTPDNRVLLFFTAGDNIKPRFKWQKPQSIPTTNFPAFLIFGGCETESFSRKSLLTNTFFPIETLKLSALCRAPGGSGWIGYDPGNSELFEISMVKSPSK